MHEFYNHLINLGVQPMSEYKNYLKGLEEHYEKLVDQDHIDYYDIEPLTSTGRHFDSKKEAEEFLYSKFEEDCRCSYSCTYILHRNNVVDKLQKRLDAEKKKLEEYTKAHSVVSFKSAFIGCPECGSKLAREYLKRMKTERCPLCETDLRGKTTLETISRYKTNINTLTKELSEEQKKASKEGRRSKFDVRANLVLVSVDTHS